jgi:uncharacterized membrane protein YjjB (DUF3815 family)
VNKTAIAIALGSIGLVLITIYVPWLSRHLSFVPLRPEALAIAIACGTVGFFANLISRLLKRTWT